jgi:hypothetical protein
MTSTDVDSHIISQVAGAAIIYEVQRSARSEARKEEARRLEIEVRQLPPTILLESFVQFFNENITLPGYLLNTCKAEHKFDLN